jgi:hypothetical protein
MFRPLEKQANSYFMICMDNVLQANRRWRLAIASILTVILCACGNGEAQIEQGGGLVSYYYEMPPEDVEIFLAKVGKLEKGAHLNEVMVLLGEPAVDEALTRKDGSFVARELTYFMKKLEKNLVNEKKDSYISIYFNENNELINYNIRR